MRKRPTNSKIEENFINRATANIEMLSEEDTDILDIHKYVSDIKWPLENDDVNPSYDEGSLLKKPISININEKEWNTIDRHVKALGVPKDKWAKRAIFKQIYIEQLAAFKKRKEII